MKYSILYLLFILLSLQPEKAGAQYHRVMMQSGTQYIGSNAVTITFTGPANTHYDIICNTGPFTLAYEFVIPLIYIVTSPLSYTYTFARPVTHIRSEVAMINQLDLLSYSLNGTAYPLAPANLAPLPPNLCLTPYDTAIIQGGFLAPPYTVPEYSFKSAAAQVNIKELSGIDSATVSFIGQVDWGGGNSGVISSFWFASIEATSNGPLCAGDSLQLLGKLGDTTLSPPGTLYWSGPNGFSSGLRDPVINPLTPADTGIYTLTYITGADTFSDTTRVSLLPGPAIPYITADSPVCAGSPLQLSAATTPGATYTWTGPDGFTASGAQVTINPVQQEHAGIYTVTASQQGCTPAVAQKITVLQPVRHSFTEVACSSTGYDFNGDLLYESGSYTDTFMGSNGCDSVNNLVLVILPGPTELQIVLPTASGPLCLDDTLQLLASGNALSYIWYNEQGDSLAFGAKLSVTLPHVSNTIILSGDAANGCTDTAQVNLTAEGCCTLQIPNAFSPNGDGLNDKFEPATNGNMRAYQISIYNRYGQRIYSGVRISDGWDGRINGVPADVGTYYYLITGTCAEGTRLHKKGDLTLLR